MVSRHPLAVFLYHLWKQGEQRTMRCHFLNPSFFFVFVLHFFFLFLSNWCFFFFYRSPPVFGQLPPDPPDSSRGVPFLIFTQVPLPILSGLIWGFCCHRGTVMEGKRRDCNDRPPSHLLSGSQSVSKVTGLAQDWPSK